MKKCADDRFLTPFWDAAPFRKENFARDLIVKSIPIKKQWDVFDSIQTNMERLRWSWNESIRIVYSSYKYRHEQVWGVKMTRKPIAIMSLILFLFYLTFDL